MDCRFSINAWATWAPGLTDQAAWLDWFAAPCVVLGDEMPALTEMPAMMRRRTELREGTGVSDGPVPGVAFPRIRWVSGRESAHQAIPYFLGDDPRRRDRIALRIAGHECLVREATLRQGHTVDQDVPPRGAGSQSPLAETAPGEERGDRSSHGQRGRDADVEAIDLPHRGGAQCDLECRGPHWATEGGPLMGTERLAVAHPGERRAPEGENCGRGHHWTSQGTAADFVDPDEE